MNREIENKKLFWYIAFIAVAIVWFFEMICSLGVWVDSAYERSLDKTEPMRMLILETVHSIASFPSIFIEHWEDKHHYDFFIIGWIIDSLFWSFLIIYLCRLAIRFFNKTFRQKII
jgi:hypothetical protein